MWRLKASALGALVFLFLLAGFYGIYDATKQVTVLSTYLRTGGWIAAQTQTEYLRFYQALTSYWAEPTEANRNHMWERFEVFWSRVPLGIEGEESRQVRQVPGAEQAYREILGALPDIEAGLVQLTPGDSAAYRRITAQVESFRVPLAEVTLAMFVGERAALNEWGLNRRSHEILFSVAALLFGGTIFIGLILRGSRLNRRLYLKASLAAQELETVERQLVDAIEAISEGFALFDREERLVLANSRFKQFYHKLGDIIAPGVTFRELVTTGLERGQYQPVPDAEPWIDRRLALWRNPSEPFEQTLADGRVLRVSDRTTAQGGHVCVRSDVTEAKHIERMLEDRLAAIEASQDGIAILDADGRYRYLNNSQASLHGFKGVADMLGTHWQDHYECDEQARFQNDILPSLRETGSWRGEASGSRGDGSSFAQDISLRVLDKGGYVCVVRDASERQEAEEERRRLLEQFHFAQRSEALGRLAGGVAHDFNSILGIIMGFSELSQSMLEDDHPVKANLGKVRSACNRAKGLVQQILAYSRQAGGERAPLRLEQLLEETTTLLRATMPATIDLVGRFERATAPVLANAGQIDQVVMNLCVNAMQAIGDRHGLIEIALDDIVIAEGVLQQLVSLPSRSSLTAMKIGSGRDGRNHKLWIGDLAPGPHVRLTVRDNGCGMDGETMRRIFDPFFTTKPVGSGTGLGLAVILGIVTAHDGGLTVESAPGEGALFEIYLPTAIAPADGRVETTLPSAALPTAGPAQTGGRILVVDDERDLVAATCGILQELGYGTAGFTDSTGAWAAVRDDPFAFDLVISDLMMPVMTGDELALRIRFVRPDLPIILSTGLDGWVSESRLREIGASAVLLKPLPYEELARAVDAALRPAATRGGAPIGASAERA